MLNVTIVPILDDNYSYILQSGDQVAVLDPGSAAPVLNKLEELGLKPDIIFTTHHHSDHVDGCDEIIKKYGCSYFDREIGQFGEDAVQTIKTPGHTIDHVCFYFPDSAVAFTADTVFSMGCGRMFEGTAEQFFNSIQKIKALPDDTLLYCGHEYTQSNGEFCLSVDADNPALQKRMKDVKQLRGDGQITIPTPLKLEKETNIFMKAKTAEEFAKYRSLKDNF